MSGQLCLKWNNHAIAFNKLLNKIYLEDVYADGTILCQGKFYPVHSFVLSTCSEYFEEMFRQCTRLNNKHPFIIVKDIQPEQMEALLNYMYKGEVNVPQEMLPELIKAAEAFKIKGLAVPDEEPSVKHSRKRSNISSPSSLPKKSRKHEEKSSSVSRTKNESSSNDDKPTENIDANSDNASTSHLFQNLNKSNDEVDTPESIITKIKEEPGDKQETIFILDDNEEPSVYPIKQEQNFQSFQEGEANIESFDFDASNDNFDASNDNFDASNFEEGQEPVPWDNSQSFGDGTTADGDPMQRLLGYHEQQEKSNESTQHRCLYTNCSYTSGHSRIMEAHYRIHTGEKPFKCPQCPYRTAQKNNIKVHMTGVHSIDKPFSCSYCDYKSTRKGNLNVHLISRHGDIQINSFTPTKI